jgi:hypothetical protein
MVEPPVESGGEKLTVAEPLPAVADTPVGAPGTVAGGVVVVVVVVVVVGGVVVGGVVGGVEPEVGGG